jgi:hypothetical protein
VEVKSGSDPVDRPTVDKLIGTGQKFAGETCLFVSWGGFRPNVQKELERDFFRVRLWSRRELLEKLFAHYAQLPEDIRLALPLKRVWLVAQKDNLTSGVGADVADLAPLHHPCFLHHGSGIKRRELKPLEQIEAPVDSDLPTVVCGDATGMEIGTGVDLPGKGRARAGEGVLNLAEVLNLLLKFFLAVSLWTCDEMDSHLITDGSDFIDQPQELRQVADLMEGTDVGIADDDAAAALEIVCKKAPIAPALGVFRHHQVLLLGMGRSG